MQIGIYLQKDKLFESIFDRRILERRSVHGFARTTPFGVEIDEQEFVVLGRSADSRSHEFWDCATRSARRRSQINATLNDLRPVTQFDDRLVHAIGNDDVRVIGDGKCVGFEVDDDVLDTC